MIKIRTAKGFTLIEIMLVVALLAILVGIAIPAYNKQKLKGNRATAINALTTAAQAEERWYTDNGTYTGNAADIGLPATTEGGRYNLGVASPTSDTFTVTATAASGQLADENCREFTIDQAGRKRSEDKDGNPSEGCWPR